MRGKDWIHKSYSVSINIDEPLLQTFWHRYGKNRRTRITVLWSEYIQQMQYSINYTKEMLCIGFLKEGY